MDTFRQIRAVFLFIFFSLLILALPHAALSKSRIREVNKIRHWSNPNYTRVVIDVSENARYYYHLLQKDKKIHVSHRRLYVDIYGSELSGKLKKKIPINDGLLKRVRAGQFKEKTVRVVLDIESIEDFKIFALSDPFRIVIDVMGKGFSGKGGMMQKTVSGPLPSEMTNKALMTSHKVKTIVIDPGHGGKDPGAIGKRGLKEKDVTLKIARALEKRLKRRSKARIVLTRKRDVFIPLEERTAIANTAQADIFVSIHINASPNRKANGVETYYLDVSNDKRSIQVAARENSATAKSTGDLQYILRDLMRTANRHDSSALATHIQDSLVSTLKKKYSGITGNGVKGAPFYVLVRTNMPSILVEASFISNPRTEKRLKSDKYIAEIADGIAGGVLDFINGKKKGK